MISALKKFVHLNRMGRIEGPPLSGVLLLSGAALGGGLFTIEIWVAAFAMAAICMNYVYLVNGATDVEEDSINAPERPLAKGLVSKKEAWVYVYLLFGLSIIYPFLLHATWTQRAIVWIILGMGYFYSMPPVRFKRFPPLATIYLVINFNLPLLLGYIMATGSETVPPFIISTVALFTANMPLKDYGDRIGDKEAGVANWANMVGPNGLLLLSTLISIAGSIATYFIMPDIGKLYWFFVFLPFVPALNIGIHKLFALNMDMMFTRGVRSLILLCALFVATSLIM